MRITASKLPKNRHKKDCIYNRNVMVEACKLHDKRDSTSVQCLNSKVQPNNQSLKIWTFKHACVEQKRNAVRGNLLLMTIIVTLKMIATKVVAISMLLRGLGATRGWLRHTLHAWQAITVTSGCMWLSPIYFKKGSMESIYSSFISCQELLLTRCRPQRAAASLHLRCSFLFFSRCLPPRAFLKMLWYNHREIVRDLVVHFGSEISMDYFSITSEATSV